MTTNVVELQRVGKREGVVAMLEDLLEEAREGIISNATVVIEYDEGEGPKTGYASTYCNFVMMLGALEHAKILIAEDRP